MTAPTRLHAARLLSNGATFGLMFAAMIGEARTRRGGGLPWAVGMAVGIEICLLLSPFAKFFGIHMTAGFVTITLAAHVVFGLGLGLCFAWQARRWAIGRALAARLA